MTSKCSIPHIKDSVNAYIKGCDGLHLDHMFSTQIGTIAKKKRPDAKYYIVDYKFDPDHDTEVHAVIEYKDQEKFWEIFVKGTKGIIVNNNLQLPPAKVKLKSGSSLEFNDGCKKHSMIFIAGSVKQILEALVQLGLKRTPKMRSNASNKVTDKKFTSPAKKVKCGKAKPHKTNVALKQECSTSHSDVPHTLSEAVNKRLAPKDKTKKDAYSAKRSKKDVASKIFNAYEIPQSVVSPLSSRIDLPLGNPESLPSVLQQNMLLAFANNRQHQLDIQPNIKVAIVNAAAIVRCTTDLRNRAVGLQMRIHNLVHAWNNDQTDFVNKTLSDLQNNCKCTTRLLSTIILELDKQSDMSLKNPFNDLNSFY